MNTEHTTETWTAYQNPEDIGSNFWHIRVAEGLGGSMRGYCGEKRARLIAAAPDLLAALKGFVLAFELTGKRLVSLSGKPTTYDKAVAAIAKAEGKA